MDVLWRVVAPSPVRAVHTELSQERDLAYTTVMTVLDRLEKKGLVSRFRQGRQWLYSPSVTREDLVADEVLEVLEMLSHDAPARHAALAGILNRLSAEDRSVLKGLLRREAS